MPSIYIPKEHLISIFPDLQPMRVKYKDIFDFKAFYEALHEWLIERDWKDIEYEFDQWETYYGERITAGGLREIWIQWRPFRQPTDARLRYHFHIDFHAVALTSTEIVRNGQKMKINKGEVELNVHGFVEKKYEMEWKDHWFLKHFTNLFTKRIYSDKLEQREKELYQEAYELQNFIKQWFKMKRYLPYDESKVFFKSVAYPSHLKE